VSRYGATALVKETYLGADGVGARAVILKSETYNFHRLDLSRQAGSIVTVFDEDGLRLGATMPFTTPAESFNEARKIVDNKVEGPRK
jgi:outer membrane scaffolding protein for murein synthesis (MipA/OmpV family)